MSKLFLIECTWTERRNCIVCADSEHSAVRNLHRDIPGSYDLGLRDSNKTVTEIPPDEATLMLMGDIV